ncbi:CK1 family protein kinase [Tritrichomonas foetus]|uniref:non-specific serine/threonine protein kinase n=1 Tax=Tritrichomonas foetus TaxID=1144522 RepID=A0A1J4KK58_9EUKA|nr:CK1 family protein kinase [Tritrichomonas foetus]|eukprot:OHT10062.1 CK1 family protein kinase [Tritrichomonas foetus]
MKRIKLDYGKVIGGYKIVKCIGSGGYGDIYYALRVTDQLPVALKTESTTALKQGLQAEIEVTHELSESPYVPRIYETGRDQNYLYIAMELLGPSLAHISIVLHGLKLGTVLKLAISMLDAVESLHEMGYIHNDIKPENFLLKPPDKVKIIDFGFNKKYVDEKGEILPRLEVIGHFGGTVSYASPNLLKKRDTGRRDDMYSWFYSIYVLLYNSFPWSQEKKASKVRRLKKKFGKTEDYEKMPICLKNIYQHILSLHFPDRPDYKYCRDELEKQFEIDKIDKNAPLDWTSLDKETVKSFSAFPLDGMSEPFKEEELVNIPKVIEQQEKAQKKKELDRNRREQQSAVCILI